MSVIFRLGVILQWHPGMIEREGWPDFRVWRFFFVFTTFDQLCDPVSLWNYQKWIPHEISHRYRSGELEKTFSERKSMKNREKSPKSTAEPRHPTIGIPIVTIGGFLKNFAKKKSPNSFVHSECSKWPKNWAAYSVKFSSFCFMFEKKIARDFLFPPCSPPGEVTLLWGSHCNEAFSVILVTFSRKKSRQIVSCTQSAPNDLKIGLRMHWNV